LGAHRTGVAGDQNNRPARRFAETGPPTIEVVLARRAGVPISVGFVSHRAGVAGLRSLTALPSAQGIGVGSAMVDHRLALARARGTDVAFMFSGGDAKFIARMSVSHALITFRG